MNAHAPRGAALALAFTSLLTLNPEAKAMGYRCYDRTSGALVADSAIDLTTPKISCVPTSAADNTTEPGETVNPAPESRSPNPTEVSPNPLAARRSINLARDTAIRLNGGLGQYRPAACMFAGASGNPCLQRESDGFLFTILGGAPGWEQDGAPATVQTILLIGLDGRSVVEEVYNGPPHNN